MKKVKVKTREPGKMPNAMGKEPVKKAGKDQVVKAAHKKSKWRLPPLGEYWKNFKDFLSEAVAELKKVSWPARKETVGATAVVILLVFILSGFLGIVDLGLSKMVKQIIK